LDNIQWVSFIVLTVTPTLAIIGLFTTEWQLKTAIWSVVYYFITGLGITAGMSPTSLPQRFRQRRICASPTKSFLTSSFPVSLGPWQATTVFGPIDPTTLLLLSSTSSPPPEPEPLRDPSSGGREDTELTIDTPIPTSTPTTPTRVSFSACCLFSLDLLLI
jgi:hypothetical protein